MSAKYNPETGIMELITDFAMDGILNWIESCENKHVQQVVYSTYHKAFTQICYGCRTVRTMMNEKEIETK